MRLSSGAVKSVCCAFLLSLGLSVAHAQYRGSLQGTVTDQNGAVIPGATVTLTNKETNQSRTAQSNSAGVYNIGGLPPSRYTLTVERSGFKKTVLEDVGILAEQPSSVDVVLQVGGAEQTVTVNGDQAALLDTETPTIGGTISEQQIQSLPAYGRDPLQLLQLAPGAFGDGSQAAGGGTNVLPSRNGPGGSNATSGIFTTQNTPAVVFGGGRQELSNITIDGVNATDAAWGGTAIVTPNIDSLKDIVVVTNDYDAEDGRYSSGQVKLVTKNGTNNWHGSAHWFVKRPGFNFAQTYNGVGGPVEDETLLNDFGGSVGGPILHNKLFFTFSWEMDRASNGNTPSGWFETPDFRAAAPADSVAANMFAFKGVEPLAGTLDAGTNSPVVKDCAFIGLTEGVNCQFIPGKGLDLGSKLTTPLGTKDPNFSTDANTGVGSGLDGIADIQFLTQSFSTPALNQQFQGRVDYNLKTSDQLFLSFIYVPVRSTVMNGSARAMNEYQQNSTNEVATLGWLHTFSPNLLNEFRGNVAGWREDSLEDNPSSPWGLPILNIQNVENYNGVGNTSINNWGISNPVEFGQWTYAAKDVLTKVQHSHTLKMGGEYSRLLFKDIAPWNARPTYQFNDLWDLLNDAPVQESATFDPKTGVPSDFRFDTRVALWGFFAQDNWKVKPNLTITAGLRWEYFGPPTEKHGNLSVVEFGQGTDVIQGVHVRTGGSLFNSSKANWGPEVGFNWSPSMYNNKVVVRGGFGLSYTALQEANSLDGRNNPPYLSSDLNLQGSSIFYGVGALPSDPTSFFGYGSNPAATIQFDPTTNLPVSGTAPSNLVAFEQNLPTTRTYHYSLDTQLDIGRGWTASLGYQGTASRHLTRLYNGGLYEYAQLAAAGNGLAAFNPSVQTVTMYDNEGYGNFNALLADIKHSVGSFNVEAQYRWAKGLDTGSNNYSPAQHNGACSCDGGSYMYTMKDDYGRSDFDVAQNFKLFGIWTPVIFHGGHQWLEKIAGGWSLSGILNWHSGFGWGPYDSSMGANAIYYGSGSAYGGGGVLRPGWYLGGLKTGNFKTQNYPNGATDNPMAPDDNKADNIFPESNPQNGAPCYVQAAGLNAFNPSPYVPGSIEDGTAAPGLIPCAPGIGRNAFKGPGYFDTDITIGKAFGLPPMKVLGENAKLNFTANIYNLFNTTNLTNIDGDVTDTTFGMALGALGSRAINLQLRFSF